MSSGLSNPSTFKRFRMWAEKNCIDPDLLKNIDFDAEFGKDLSYNEAIETALHKFPTVWRTEIMEDFESRPKQIIFIKELIPKIIEGEIQVTYRKSPKIGLYYVIENRFKQSRESSRLLIEFYRTDKINPAELGDEEARLAGIDSADRIRDLFKKWYGEPIPLLYRNWFKLKGFM